MNENTKNQVGSPSRDLFKRKHKDLSRQFFACDMDFVFVEKVPFPDIVAAIDYKQDWDSVTFSESIAYTALVRRGIPVYIVTGDCESGCFSVKQYIGGHFKKPVARYSNEFQVQSWEEFEQWEEWLREEYRKLFGP